MLKHQAEINRCKIAIVAVCSDIERRKCNGLFCRASADCNFANIFSMLREIYAVFVEIDRTREKESARLIPRGLIAALAWSHCCSNVMDQWQYGKGFMIPQKRVHVN